MDWTGLCTLYNHYKGHCSSKISNNFCKCLADILWKRKINQNEKEHKGAGHYIYYKLNTILSSKQPTTLTSKLNTLLTSKLHTSNGELYSLHTNLRPTVQTVFCQVLPPPLLPYVLPCSPLSPCGEENKEIAAWHFSVIKLSTQQSTTGSNTAIHITQYKRLYEPTIHLTNSAEFFTSVLLNTFVHRCKLLWMHSAVQCSVVHYGDV